MRDGKSLTRADLIRDAHAVGMDPEQIASEFGIDPHYVRVILWRTRNPERMEYYNCKLRETRVRHPRIDVDGWTEVEIMDLLTWVRAGVNMRVCGNRLGRSRNAVAGKIYRLRKRGVDV
jgi:hypothetical protein